MQAYGGVSIVNALPSWYGSTMALDIRVSVNVKEGIRDRSKETNLIKVIIDYFKEKYSIPDILVEVNSELPQQGGLKSSSAVSVALISEIFRKFDIRDPIFPPVLSSILSIKAGVSYTGALDDATAAFCGGISYTYNKYFKIIKVQKPIGDISVLVLTRGGRQINIDIKKLRDFQMIFEEIFSIALKDPLEAMKLNGILIANLLGYSIDPIRDALKKGAIASGISGNGPSYFAVVKEGDEGPVYEILKRYGNVIITRPMHLDCKDLPI